MSVSAVLLGREASKRGCLLGWALIGSGVEGFKDESILLFLDCMGAGSPLLSERSSVDDFGCWSRVAPVVQELEFHSCGWFSCVNEEGSDGRGNVDWRE